MSDPTSDLPPPPADPQTQTGAAAPGVPPPEGWGRPAVRGPVGQPRSIGISILLAIVTLGIYALVWTYKTHDEMKRYSGNGLGGGLGLVLYIFTGGVATYFLVPYELEQLHQAEGQASPVRTVTGFWVLLPLVGGIVWFVKVQGALNDFWQQRGAPAP